MSAWLEARVLIIQLVIGIHIWPLMFLVIYCFSCTLYIQHVFLVFCLVANGRTRLSMVEVTIDRLIKS
jgi:hypothetical protein